MIGSLVGFIFLVMFLLSATNEIPQWGIGLFLLLFLLDFIFSGLTDKVFGTILKLIRNIRVKSRT